MHPIQRAKTIAGYYKTSLLRRIFSNYRKSFNFSTEADHWQHVLNHLSELPESVQRDFRNRLNPERELEEPLASLIRSLPEPWRILDVGCGPLSTIGIHLGNQRVELIGVDPLADTYRSQLAAANLSPNCELIQTDCSDLTERFSNKHFSITCSINALDHAPNPLGVISQMAAVTAPRGYVYLRHAENEGIRERYRGLHQWNFSIGRGLPTLSDGRARMSIVEAVPALTLLEARRKKERDANYVIFLFRKNGS